MCRPAIIARALLGCGLLGCTMDCAEAEAHTASLPGLEDGKCPTGGASAVSEAAGYKLAAGA